MTESCFELQPERPGDDMAVQQLHETVFGPGRFARTAFRLREGVPHAPELSFVARQGAELIGSVRLTRIRIGETPALLLGPLAVAPDFMSRGAGRKLVAASLEAARDNGHGVVLLVGDEPYYGPLGFQKLPRGSVRLPGPVDPERLLACPLRDGALIGLEGMAGA